MLYATFFLSAVAVLAAAWVHRWTEARIAGLETAPAPAYDDRALLRALDDHKGRLDAQRDELGTLHQLIEDQNLAIAEGIERTDRAERRVRAAVARAKSRMEEAGFVDEAVEAEASQLRFDYGNDGQGEPMPPVREGVEGTRPSDSWGLLNGILPGDFS